MSLFKHFGPDNVITVLILQVTDRGVYLIKVSSAQYSFNESSGPYNIKQLTPSLYLRPGG